jgi:putative tryptophan/tyrosine transport system substrate-binding protein
MKLSALAALQGLRFSQSWCADLMRNSTLPLRTRGQADAVVIQGSLSTKRVADLALERRLPAASTTRAFVDAGGLMSYGADGPALFRLGAKFVHRILQGRQPRDLPIEQPTKFELAVNLKTAKAMGLTIPESFLLRADALVE